MKIDAEIRHVTMPGANLFLELGFTLDEAKRLQAASRKQINDTRLLKRQLMEELSVWIAKHRLKQAGAAGILMVSRPRVFDVVNKKTAKFTVDRSGKCSAVSASRSSWQSVDRWMFQCLGQIFALGCTVPPNVNSQTWAAIWFGSPPYSPLLHSAGRLLLLTYLRSSPAPEVTAVDARVV